MPDPFPKIQLKNERKDQEDFNPAIRLHGRRFFADQTVPELLIEFLLIAASQKRVEGRDIPASALLPPLALLQTWPARTELEYASKARLNLKLFAFLSASKLDTRHSTHREHYTEFTQILRSSEKLSAGSLDVDDVIKTLENLFLGLQSIGGQRTWCAQAFLPLNRSLLAGETLWNQTAAAREKVESWSAVRDSARHFFSVGRHRFLARGGELLYLQLCNALRQESFLLDTWWRKAGLSLSPPEADPSQLHEALTRALGTVLNACPETVGKLAEFLDTGIDQATAQKTDLEGGSPRFTSCGWCPEEGWREGWLFAVEILRICNAVIDPIERVELLQIGCAMQLLRSLCAQSARYTTSVEEPPGTALGFLWAISDPDGQNTVVKQISRRNVNAVQRQIHGALRHPQIRDGFDVTGDELDKIYKEADSRYGHKLFLTVAKRLGFIIPKRGTGARFVFTDKLLRFFVMALVRPGERVTYETFKRLLLAHYGIAVDDEGLAAACVWSGTSRLSTLGGKSDAWLTEMLAASGVLIRLSDACSLVMNPFIGQEMPR